MEFTKQLKDLVLNSNPNLEIDEQGQKQVITAIKARNTSRHKAQAASLQDRASPDAQRAMDLSQEKGASCVYTVVPLAKHGFAIKSKQVFTDYTRMRYRKPILGLPETCSCGKPYSLEHSQQCLTGGFIHMRHDEPKDLHASVCSLVYRDFEVEPPLQSAEGHVFKHKSAITEDGARSDVRVRSFWSKQRNAFFEFRVFYAFASSYRNQSLPQLYKKFGNLRTREYAQRIHEVEDGDFTPMIMSTSGGMGPEMQIAIKHLARKVAVKQKNDYSRVASLLRCKFSFAMMRSAMVCLSGSRSPWQFKHTGNPLEGVDRACIELSL